MQQLARRAYLFKTIAEAQQDTRLLDSSDDYAGHDHLFQWVALLTKELGQLAALTVAEAPDHYDEALAVLYDAERSLVRLAAIAVSAIESIAEQTGQIEPPRG